MNNKLIKTDYETLIFTIRGIKVMIDYDLAILYDVPVKALKQQTKRNADRFPEDFMFELSANEKSKLVTNCDRFKSLKHSIINPMAFTEQGVAMLSSVLRSEKAIKINIEIMRAFARYRAILKETSDLRLEINKLDEKINTVFKILLEKIDALHQVKNIPRRNIGFKKDEN